jgi:hypothetical protein
MREVSLLLVLTMLSPSLASVRGDKAAYVGGTVKTFKEGEQGLLVLDDTKELVFKYEKSAEFHLPYAQITSLEFGQKVGRRVGATFALGVTTLGVGALPLLFSKKKKHFLTIAFTEPDGQNGVLVLELSKNIVRTTLPILEARTGKKVEMEEATAKQGKDRS